MVWAVRFELTACGFQVRHSTKLSYAQGINGQSGGRGRNIAGKE